MKDPKFEKRIFEWHDDATVKIKDLNKVSERSSAITIN